jgi:hypothetical protein
MRATARNGAAVFKSTLGTSYALVTPVDLGAVEKLWVSLRIGSLLLLQVPERRRLGQGEEHDLLARDGADVVVQALGEPALAVSGNQEAMIPGANRQFTCFRGSGWLLPQNDGCPRPCR